MALSDREVKNFKPKEKTYKKYDEQGLFLIVTPKANKWWRFKYTINKKEQTLSLGVYPNVSLAEARNLRDALVQQLKAGKNPSISRKQDKLAQANQNTFKDISMDWFKLIQARVTPNHHAKLIKSMELHIFPLIGSVPINEIQLPQFIDTIKRIEAKGSVETAHRLFNLCSKVFKYAVANQIADRNIANDFDKQYILKPTIDKHYKSITDTKELSVLLKDIATYNGYPTISYALKLAPLLFLRSGELTKLEWREVDFASAMITIPAEKMKMKVTHFVPLSRQALELLKELHGFSCKSTYLFPSPRGNSRPITRESLVRALRALGYDISVHSFRSTASTILHENIDTHGFHSDVIERQLAHSERNGVKAAYNHAQYIPQRKEMMQWWSDYLEGLK